MSKILALASALTLGTMFGISDHAAAHFHASRTEAWTVAQAVERVSGTITRVDRISRPNRPWTGTHLSLRTADQVLDVMLGPSDYVEAQGMTFQVGQQVSVSGVRTGPSSMVAYDVQVGGQVLRLRNENGVPLWAGRGRGS